MDLFNKVHPNDINLEVGIGYKGEELNYYMFNESALNSFSKSYHKIGIKHKTHIL